MDMQAIMQAISSVGFPIVMCGALAYYIKYTTDESNARIEKIEEQHREETQEFTKSLNDNTQAIVRLLDFLRGGADNESDT